jgi:hypothetical protein
MIVSRGILIRSLPSRDISESVNCTLVVLSPVASEIGAIADCHEGDGFCVDLDDLISLTLRAILPANYILHTSHPFPGRSPKTNWSISGSTSKTSGSCSSIANLRLHGAGHMTRVSLRLDATASLVFLVRQTLRSPLGVNERDVQCKPVPSPRSLPYTSDGA